MAKLSAHGRELLRVEKETEINDPNENITWRRVTRAYFGDGKILSKTDVRWKPDQYRPNGEHYSFGWKLHGKLKAGFNMPDHVALVRANLAKPESKWKVVGGAPIVMISQARIVAACERGDGTGFCQACGATAHNVEPDARGYTCESCGKPEVYGAEELLMGGAL